MINFHFLIIVDEFESKSPYNLSPNPHPLSTLSISHLPNKLSTWLNLLINSGIDRKRKSSVEVKLDLHTTIILPNVHTSHSKNLSVRPRHVYTMSSPCLRRPVQFKT